MADKLGVSDRLTSHNRQSAKLTQVVCGSNPGPDKWTTVSSGSPGRFGTHSQEVSGTRLFRKCSPAGVRLFVSYNHVPSSSVCTLHADTCPLVRPSVSFLCTTRSSPDPSCCFEHHPCPPPLSCHFEQNRFSHVPRLLGSRCTVSHPFQCSDVFQGLFQAWSCPDQVERSRNSSSSSHPDNFNTSYYGETSI